MPTCHGNPWAASIPGDEPTPLPPRQSLEREIDRYLRPVQEEHHLLPVAGYETEVKIPITLSKVYVSLRARGHRVLGDAGCCWGSHAAARQGKEALEAADEGPETGLDGVRSPAGTSTAGWSTT